jgi:ribosomal protein L33
MPYNKLFIKLACSVCTEKYRTSVFLYKPCPTGSVCTKKTSVRYFTVQTSRSVSKKLIIFYLSGQSSVCWTWYSGICWQSVCRWNVVQFWDKGNYSCWESDVVVPILAELVKQFPSSLNQLRIFWDRFYAVVSNLC